MTITDAPPATAPRAAPLRTLSEQMPRFMRLIHAMKAQGASADRDRAALVLLFPLVRVGPLRQGALAELVHADPSTVSRHVATLVDRGLVRRIADESDGRASRLIVTDDGHEALAALRLERENHFERVTADWSVDDLTTFTSLFGRLLDDFANALPNALPGVSDVCAPTDIPREN
jgi:DNA-binding MarR family transcriptional regulator